jgi:hypothetical protein
LVWDCGKDFQSVFCLVSDDTSEIGEAMWVWRRAFIKGHLGEELAHRLDFAQGLVEFQGRSALLFVHGSVSF